MKTSTCWALAALLTLPAALGAEPKKPKGDKDNDPRLIALLEQFNGGLRAEWMDIRGEQIELLAQGTRRGGRLHERLSRWVENDPRRAGGGAGISYVFDSSDLVPPGGLPAAEADQALRQAVATWTSQQCLAGVPFSEAVDDGADPDLFDSLFGHGTLGTYLTADIVFAGWMPAAFFEAVTPSSEGESVIAMAVTFVFVDQESNPTDIDGDGSFDTALTEVYFNAGFPWSMTAEPATVDLETVVLHELGHALSLDHDTKAGVVMNPVYGGVRRALEPRDRSALCPVWSRWH